MTYKEEMRKIAREYFTDILYIDDHLKPPENFSPIPEQPEIAATLESSIASPISRPVRSRRGDAGEIFFPSVPVDESGLFRNAYSLVMAFQQIGCKASPFYFSSPDSAIPAAKLIAQSHLTILDWNLDSSEGATTVKLLENVLENKKRMKLLVIFTSKPDQATKSLFESFKCDIETRKIDGREYSFTYTEGALIVICDRGKFSAENILGIVVDHILDKFGLFPLTFFQSINQINQETAAILMRFSHPFENALLLQLLSSDLDLEDFSPVVGRMVSNHLSKVIEINKNIFLAVIEEWRSTLTEWIGMPEQEFMKVVTDCLTEIINMQHNGTNGKKNKDVLKLLSGVKYKDWIDILKLAVVSCADKKTIVCIDTVKKVITEATKVQAEQNLASEAEFKKIDGMPEVKAKCLKLLEENSFKDIKEILEPLVPSIIVHMIMSYRKKGQLSASLGELVNMMKLLPYENPSLTDLEGKAGKDAFNNIFHNGDIIYQQPTGGEIEFLFCISPSCDVFRPDKILNQLKFVVGKKLKSDAIFQELKDSEQITILQDPVDSTKLICIKWDYFNTRVIPIPDLKNYLRPYRLESTYAQQITNNYISYHSRAGVEELFFKHKHSMRNFFVFSKV